jgi:hypothetical protein
VSMRARNSQCAWPACRNRPVTRVQPEEESDRADSRDPADRLAQRVEQGSAGLPVAVQVIGRP